MVLGFTPACSDAWPACTAGLAPEAVLLVNASMAEGEMMASPSYYIMRPETVESFFYLWRVTGDQRYRDWGWK